MNSVLKTYFAGNLTEVTWSFANGEGAPHRIKPTTIRGISVADVLPELRGIAGFRGAYLSRRNTAGHVEFLVLTRWDSMNAIRAFAGSDAERAVVEPGGGAALADFDPHVRHYEVLADVSSPG